MENPLPEQTWARIGIYLLYGTVVFLIAFALTFPDDQIADIAEVRLEGAIERSQKTNYTVHVGDVDPWWLGVELENVSIEKVAPPTPSGGGGGASDSGASSDSKGSTSGGSASSRTTLQLSASSIGARLAPIGSILNGGLSVAYHLGIGGGSISGTYTRTGSSQLVTASIAGVKLRKTRLMSKFTGVPAFGKLDGSANLQLAANRPLLTGGTIELEGKKLTIGPKEEVKIPGIPLANLTIPQTSFGNLNIEMHVEYKEGQGPPKLVVDTFNTRGRDLKTQIWGDLKLAGTLGNAQSRLKMRINFNPEFIKGNELTPLLQQDLFRNGRSGDWYGFVLWGPLKSANFNGATTPAKGPKEGKDSGNKPQGGGSGGNDGAPAKKKKKGG
jgi:type II secretion system protein N